jgi:hypothetical protein
MVSSLEEVYVVNELEMYLGGGSSELFADKMTSALAPTTFTSQA